MTTLRDKVDQRFAMYGLRKRMMLRSFDIDETDG